MPDVIHDPKTDWCACTPGGDMVCGYRLLADAVIERLSPPDGDEAEEGICITAIERAAAFIASLPCTCEADFNLEPCGRCDALGQWHGKPREY